ncbi:phosphatidate cytidylyltransferase [Halorussus pelagicus]|uniref:phosphatidate cytidylyltransferase n=1 Tax=Halorussus pelagicus TaxID=2505977 RepID=UPI000FFBBEAF|nr:phosphatidate cytidylyltransferase [Halorussus pelagicus]
MVIDAFRSRGLSVGRLSVTVILLALVVAAAVYDDPGLPSLVLVGTGIAFFAASAVRRVREHAAWNVASNAALVVWGLALFVAGSDPTALASLLVVVGLVGVVIESYNYRHGTSYGRISWSE